MVTFCPRLTSVRCVGTSRHSQRHSLSAGLDAHLGRLQNPHHAKPGLAVGHRLLTTLDAIEEVPDLHRQGFCPVQRRGPHIATAIAHLQLVDPLAIVRLDLDALVVNPELLRRFDVVEDDHAFATAKEHLAHLDRAEPVDVKVRNQLVVEVEMQVREEMQREYESRPLSIATRAELEQQIRNDMREEFDARRRLEESVVGAEVSPSIQALEARLRNEIEIQVRQEFLDQISVGGTIANSASSLQAPHERSLPGVSNFAAGRASHLEKYYVDQQIDPTTGCHIEDEGQHCPVYY